MVVPGQRWGQMSPLPAAVLTGSAGPLLRWGDWEGLVPIGSHLPVEQIKVLSFCVSGLPPRLAWNLIRFLEHLLLMLKCPPCSLQMFYEDFWPKNRGVCFFFFFFLSAS